MDDLVIALIAVGACLVLCLLGIYLAWIKPPANASIAKSPPTLDLPSSHHVPYPEGKQFWSLDKKTPKPIRFAQEGIASQSGLGFEPTTIPKLFQRAVQNHGSDPAMRVERPCPSFVPDAITQAPSLPFAEWTTWTYRQYFDESYAAAKGMVALGLERYDAVTIYGFNCPEWFMAQHAGIMGGGIAAGIYPSDTPAQVTFKAKHSGASIAVCQANKAQIFLDAFEQGSLPKLKAIVVWGTDFKQENFENSSGQRVVKVSWKTVVESGRASESKTVDNTMESLQPGDVVCLIYTSGTTGDPKAVMITHDNLIFESCCAKHLMPGQFLENGQERVLSYLPLSHVAGCMVDIIMPIVGTAISTESVVVGFARVYDLSKGTLGDRLRCVQPTIFLGVPRVWEKIADKIKKIGASITGLKKKISTFCKKKGLEHANHCQLGGSGEFPSWFKFADGKVFTPLKERLGLGLCKFAFTGAAPITHETLSYFGALGLQINEVYGMSECTGATTWSTDNAHVWGSCGFAMPGCEVKVFQCSDSDMNDKKECPRSADIFQPREEEQGEICFRGRHIMHGYLANPDFGEEHVALITKKNKGAIDNEGWLHSGDKGVVGTNGMFKITGRYKELIIGSGGENIAPVPIEDNIKLLCPAISNIMMIGDKKKYNTAFITLKAQGATGEVPGGNDLDGAARDAVPGVSTISGAASNSAFIQVILDAIRETNSNDKVVPSRAAKIQKFTILPRDFSVETGELTPTLKLKRSYVMKMREYADVLDRLYAPGAPDYVPFKLAAGPVESDDVRVNVKEAASSVTQKQPLLSQSGQAYGATVE